MVNCWRAPCYFTVIGLSCRAPIYAGNITGEDVFNVLPFDNMVDMVSKVKHFGDLHYFHNLLELHWIIGFQQQNEQMTISLLGND